MISNLTVVIPYRDDADALVRLVPTIPKYLPVIVVDDCNDKRVPWDVRRREGLRIIRAPTRGFFSGAVNIGLAFCDTDVLVLNQDIWFDNDAWVDELDALRKDYAIIGDGVMDHPAWPKGYVQGTFMFLRRDAIDAVGKFDEVNWPLWGATAEWQLRACRKGFRALPIANCNWFYHGRKGAYGASILDLLRKEPQNKSKYIRTPPLISVVTACYNYGMYIPDLVSSLVGGRTCLGERPGQTFQGFEVVICDDCSTDDSWGRIQKVTDEWKGIRAVRTSHNSGTAKALNTAIESAHGKYIMVVDADDMLAPTALEEMLAELEEDLHSFVYCDQLLFSDKGFGAVWKMKEYDFESLLDRNHVPTGTMFTKDAWKEVGGFPEVFARGRQDWAWAVRMGEHGYCGRRVPRPLYLYRRDRHNRSLRNSSAEWRKYFVTLMHQTFPELYEGERPVGCCGGSKARVNAETRSVRRSPSGSILPGQEGMVLLEYIGGNAGKMRFFGPVTRLRYVFGGTMRMGYVDARDVDALLALRETRRPVFRRVSSPVAPQEEESSDVVEVVEEKKVPTVEIVEDAETESSEGVVVEDTEEKATAAEAVDVGRMTIAEIQSAIEGASIDDLSAWLEREKAERKRVTVLRMLESILDRREGEEE